jgi:hypothetical protein
VRSWGATLWPPWGVARKDESQLFQAASRKATYRRWPMASPKLNAFWRIAPAVLFIAFEILATGVLLFECALRSRTCSLVHVALRIKRGRFQTVIPESTNRNMATNPRALHPQVCTLAMRTSASLERVAVSGDADLYCSMAR